jgi:hypothetical protein
VLLGIDEYPFHQIAQPFAAAATSDAQWNDGHYICACDAGGRVSLAASVRLYPNNDVLDGFVCIRHRDRQHNIRLSRRLRPNIGQLAAGPLRLEIVEPLERVRLVLEPNDFGLELDVTCQSTVLPYLDPVETTRVDGRLLSERVTYEVTGRCSGWVSVGNERIVLDPDRDSFFRNHSWGVHPGRGGPRLYAGTSPRHRAPGLRQWVLFSMPSHGGFFFQDPSGRSAAGKAAIVYRDRSVPVVSVEHELEFYEGGRRLHGGWFRLTDAAGIERTYQVEDLGWVYCQGGGYFGGFNDRLGQGVYRGDLHVEGETWDVSHPTQVVDETGRSSEFEHAWAESFTRLSCGTEQGLAHYECVVIGEPHPADPYPSGSPPG